MVWATISFLDLFRILNLLFFEGSKTYSHHTFTADHLSWCYLFSLPVVTGFRNSCSTTAPATKEHTESNLLRPLVILIFKGCFYCSAQVASSSEFIVPSCHSVSGCFFLKRAVVAMQRFLLDARPLKAGGTMNRKVSTEARVPHSLTGIKRTFSTEKAKHCQIHTELPKGIIKWNFEFEGLRHTI